MAKKIEPQTEVGDSITIEARIKGLIQALGANPIETASIEVSRTHIRVLGKDRSLRSHRVAAWDAEEEEGGE